MVLGIFVQTLFSWKHGFIFLPEKLYYFNIYFFALQIICPPDDGFYVNVLDDSQMMRIDFGLDSTQREVTGTVLRK